jgi:hypothetical protein
LGTRDGAYAAFKFPDKADAMGKIRDLTCLSDILPTGFPNAKLEMALSRAE